MFRELESWTAHLPKGEYCGVTVSDIDLDGRFELLTANRSGPNRILKWSDGRLREVVSPVVAAAGTATFGIAAADVDGDGREELLLVGESGRLLRHGADGQWTVWSERGRRANGFIIADRRGTGRHGILASNEWIEAASDGSLAGLIEPRAADAIRVKLGESREFIASSEDAHRLLAANRDVATPSLAFPSDVRAAIAADFDNDGFEELLLVNGDEWNRLYRIGEDVTQLDIGDATEGGFGAAAADLDGDGVLELVIANSETIRVFKPRTASGNAWLRIQPLTRFNAPARGAIVRCRVNGRTLVRTVDAGSMSLSLGEPVAHFGLGRDPRIEWVSITWPDGSTLRLPEPDVNCTYSVPYPRG